MDRRRSNDTDVISDFYRSITDLREQIVKLRNNNVVTLPVYDKSNLPADVLENELFIGTDNTLNFKRGGTIHTL